jgi:DNA-binding GntR family transcriptional regulator
MRKVEVILPEAGFSTLDRSGSAPLHSQLTEIIGKAIHSGALSPGDRMENEVSLGERLGLSRPTIRRAIAELVNQGLLVRRRGVGTQVVQGQITRGLELTSLFDDLRAAGLKPQTQMLEMKRMPASNLVAEKLDLPVGFEVLHIRRLRLASGKPVAVMENWLNPEYADPKVSEIQSGGLYACLKEQGIEIRVAKQNIGARKASAEEARLLEIESNGPVLTMDRTGYDKSGHAIEFGHHCYRTDIYSFEFTLVGR